MCGALCVGGRKNAAIARVVLGGQGKGCLTAWLAAESSGHAWAWLLALTLTPPMSHMPAMSWPFLPPVGCQGKEGWGKGSACMQTGGLDQVNWRAKMGLETLATAPKQEHCACWHSAGGRGRTMAANC